MRGLEMNQSFINQIDTDATINEDNLLMAIQVHAAFDAIKSKIFTEFAFLLKNELVKALTDISGINIDVQPLLEKPLEKYTGLTISHPTWPDDWSVLIEAQSPHGKEILIGVGGSKDKANVTDRNAIKAKLDTDIAPGNISDGWTWYRKVKPEFNDWSQEDTLIDLFKEIQGDALICFRDELVAIVQRVHAHFDKNYVIPVSSVYTRRAS